jgi:eukaryotic-like serine/threonine-protein kinase
MWWMAADGTGVPERMATSRNPQLATSITSDGRHLVYHEATPDSSIDILQMTLDGTQQITPLLHSKSWEQEGVVSPDGRWLAYECCTEKQPEIWVSPYPNVQAGRWQLSTGGGRYPVWSPTNKELFFIAADASIMSVTIEASGSAWQAGPPTKLFDSRYFKGYERSYDVSRDGRRLLLIKPPGNDSSTAPPQIIVVQHWDEELRRLFPAK